ncbi:MAG: sugar nucleotide-binding protein [Pseudomonadota bacterium]|nr:sugar nucleotide-binding protein [Pseudomonadota bacterium]
MTDSESAGKPDRIDLWGGPECTICRIGDQWRDQSQATGHDKRLADLDLIAELGIKTVRYPILWERAAADCSSSLDFSWADRQLDRLRTLGIDVIGGLTHHGSGPQGTDLLDEEFPSKLADYAAHVAQRYPWIDKWTPVNEPLTTARFSALYGHWYPHKKDFTSFARALINQCLGTVRAMAAIRCYIPTATLIQTEDIGRTFATPQLQQQADHDNLRSWLSLDLLFGRVDKRHPLYARLRRAGISEAAFEELIENAERPTMIGVNHYLTSDRFLDHRCKFYPDEAVGGNGRQKYVDVEAVRVAHLVDCVGITHRLREVWQRYRAPIAITEVHHGCTHDEQLRWLCEVWESAHRVKAEGADIRAVTLWSMFGNVDWRSLLTRFDDHYDPGVFDARSDPPRPTILATAAKALAAGEQFDHPALSSPGWWRRPNRFYGKRHLEHVPEPTGAPLLIVGATGTLGSALAMVAHRRGLPVRLTSRSELNIEDQSSIRRFIAQSPPWAIINAAGYVRVADAERDEQNCFAANAKGAENLAAVAADRDIPLVGISSDLVFDGTSGPYGETDACHPRGVYGHSKRAGEIAMLEASSRNLVVRTSAFFGPWDQHNFAFNTLTALKRGERVEAPEDVRVSPTYVPDLCHGLLDLLIDGGSGLWHLANPGSLSWYHFALRLAELTGVDSNKLTPISGEASDTTLISTRGTLLRPLDAAMAEYCANFASIEQSFTTAGGTPEMAISALQSC